MTYKLNGVEIPQPTTGRWLPKNVVARTGRGYPIYPSVMQYELRYSVSSPADVEQIRLVYAALGLTGTVVADLPKYDSTTYVFYAYSGCCLYEPERGSYFSEYITETVFIIGNIIV